MARVGRRRIRGQGEAKARRGHCRLCDCWGHLQDGQAGRRLRARAGVGHAWVMGKSNQRHPIERNKSNDNRSVHGQVAREIAKRLNYRFIRSDTYHQKGCMYSTYMGSYLFMPLPFPPSELAHSGTPTRPPLPIPPAHSTAPAPIPPSCNRRPASPPTGLRSACGYMQDEAEKRRELSLTPSTAKQTYWGGGQGTGQAEEDRASARRGGAAGGRGGGAASQGSGAAADAPVRPAVHGAGGGARSACAARPCPCKRVSGFRRHRLLFRRVSATSSAPASTAEPPPPPLFSLTRR